MRPLKEGPSASDPILDEIVQRLVEVYHPFRIYLFGSVARGDARPDSDYDLMVVVPDDTPTELLSVRSRHEALKGINASKDVKVWPESEFDRQLHLKASFPSTIVREGRVLYMPKDPVLISNTRKWLTLAHRDLNNAGYELLADPPYLESSLFHSQQAAEKAMKAFLTFHDCPFGRTHDLKDLGKLCARLEPSLAIVAGRVEYLADYAIELRYPDPAHEPTLKEAQDSIALVRDLFQAIIALLPAELQM